MIGHLSWAYRIPAPLVPGVATKTRLEARFTTIQPYLTLTTASPPTNTQTTPWKKKKTFTPHFKLHLQFDSLFSDRQRL